MTVCAMCGHENREGARFCEACGAPLEAAPASREQRKTVTVLFCDVTGSTALGESTDPEALRALLARYFERMKAIVESHGGTVEKFIGDAVMAVFGVPQVHEDDALRAVRAAVEMRDALPELGVQARIGVNTGEVVTGTQERLATGDAVNVAARLEQAAEPGEVLIGEATHALVGAAVVAEPVEPLTLKGKSEPVPTLRLVSVLDAPERSHVLPFVGRARDVGRIVEAWEHAQAQARCELVTVVGDAGVGKSRLVAEALRKVEARVLQGRCLPYGEGITYWPVVEVVKQLAVLPSDPAAAAALSSLLGESEVGASGDEIAWAFRKLLEEQAPLVVVFDDIQWGEERFLDLVESTALLSAGAPLVLLCMARPELVERRPGWPGSLRLEPLPPEQAETMIGDAVSGELRERIARAAGGNPLFISEMLAMAAGNAEIEVPPTLKALLAARLDQLDEAERKVLERGAVEGELFHAGAIRVLVGGEGAVTPRLTALVRRQLIRRDRALLVGDDGYRFRHLLIRDAAYDALPKAIRADLHARLAAWLDEHGRDLVELDEIVGYHLEQAALYASELGQADPALSLRAGERLAAAGRRALWRGDEPAAASLLERALELTRPLRLDVSLELDLVDVLLVGDPQRGSALADAAADAAGAAGERASEALARVVAADGRRYLGTADADELDKLAQSALRLLEHAGDHAGLARVWAAIAHGVANSRAQYGEMARACKRVELHTRLAGQPRSHEYYLALALVVGPTPADEALRTLDAVVNPRPQLLLFRAVLLAMLGRFDEAWPLALETNERLRSLSDTKEIWLGVIGALDGDHETAARYYLRALGFFQGVGNEAAVSLVAPLLARELCALGRDVEAEPLAARGRELASESYVPAQLEWRQAQALVDAAAGRYGEAERLAREAVAIAAGTDSLNHQGDALGDLAQVLETAGRAGEAVDALEQALDRYERKQNVAMAAQIRRLLAMGNKVKPG